MFKLFVAVVLLGKMIAGFLTPTRVEPLAKRQKRANEHAEAHRKRQAEWRESERRAQEMRDLAERRQTTER